MLYFLNGGDIDTNLYVSVSIAGGNIITITSCFFVLAYYEEFKKSMKNPCQNGPKSDPKIDVWAIRGPTFEVLGGFLISLSFDVFSIVKKLA